MKKILFSLLCIFIALPSLAFDNNDYKKFVEKVKEEVWGQELPQFKNRNVPAKYKNESAVILARYEEVIVDQKHKFSFLAHDKFVKQINGTQIQRYLIQIKDKAALDKFSTFDFRTYNRSYSYFGRDDHRTVLGVKVIKADGTERIIDSSDYQDVEEGKKGKDKRAKLAVPDLQIGDFIDYFFYDLDYIKEENMPPFTFVFRSKYPTLDYQIHCAIDKKMCTQYRAMNGAPNFTASKDDDNVILDVRVKDIEKTLPQYAYKKTMQTPYTALYVTGKVAVGYIPKSTKEKGLHANPSAKEIQLDAWKRWKDRYDKWIFEDILRKTIAQSKKMKSDEEKANFIYDYMVMRSLVFKEEYMNYDIQFGTFFSQALKKAKVPFTRVISTTWSDEALSNIINFDNAVSLIELKNGQLFSNPNVYSVSGKVLYSQLQNREAQRSKSSNNFSEGPFEDFKTLASKSSDNIEKIDVNATIDDALLHITRTETLTGNEKEGVIPTYATAEEICKAWGEPYGVHGYADILSYKKSKGEAAAKERAEADKKEIGENFQEEIKNYHDKAPVSIESTEVTSVGQNNTPFTYKVTYTMDGLVKKAGKNLTLSVGQLIGQQTHIEGKERQRTDDIIFSYPRTFVATINVELPSGYSVTPESLQKLNTNLDNEDMRFVTKAEVMGNKLFIHFEKEYKKQIVPVARWQNILEILDRAYEFNNQQVILRKK